MDAASNIMTSVETEKIGEQMEGTKKENKDKLGFGRLMLWQSRSVSQTIVTLLMVYLMIYCTDTLLMPPALVSALMVGSKIVDGVTDAFAGFIVDKTQTKWGKGRPYEVFILLLWLCTWLLFSCPVQFQLVAKAIWVFVMYVMANAICYTFLNANVLAYSVRVFSEKQLVRITSYGAVITMLVAVVFNVVFPGIMANIATSASGWSRLVLMLAVPFAAIGFLRFIFFKETIEVETPAQKKKQLKISDIWDLIKGNKYIVILAVMNFIFNFVTNMGVQVYYFKYIVKNVGVMGALALVQVIAIPLAFIFPKLIEKFSTEKLMMVGFFISAIGYFLNFIAGANVPLLCVAAVLWGAGTVPGSMLIMLAMMECADYNEWKGRHRMEGTMGSVTGLAKKIGAAIGSGALGVFLSIAGYSASLETIPDSAITMIRMLYSLVPAVLYIFTALTLSKFDLGKQMPQIKADLEEMRKADANE